MEKRLIILCIALASLTLKPLTQEHLTMIEEVVKVTSNQMSLEERLEIATTLTEKAPCNCLIFGVGRDSQLWMDLNKNGRTVFLEDSNEWLEMTQEQVPNIEAYLVSYNTKITEWKSLLNKPSLLKMELPQEIASIKWDVIIVDAPTGYDNKCTGRMKSIFTAAQLAKENQNTDVFVHDCNRNVEKTYANKYLSPKNLIKQIRKLRHYKINKQEN